MDARYFNRRAHFSSIAINPAYDAYHALCSDPGLYLDSFLQV